jgi:hypothetical protein
MSTATKVAKPQTKKPEPKCNLKKIKTGSMLSRHVFAVVTDIRSDSIGLRNDAGEEWHLDKQLVENQCSFADQFENEESISRTKAIALMTSHPFTATTVHFHKKPKPEEVAIALKAGQGAQSNKEWEAQVEQLMNGEERTMVGHHASNLDEHGRLQFFEFDTGPRLVDPRTINWLVLNRIKYTIKAK